MSKIENERVPASQQDRRGLFLSNWRRGARRALVLQLLSLVGIQLGHFLHVDAYTLAVEKHKIHCFDGRGHRRYEVIGDGLQNQLSCRLLRKTIPAGERTRAQQLSPAHKDKHYKSTLEFNFSIIISICFNSLKLCQIKLQTYFSKGKRNA